MQPVFETIAKNASRLCDADDSTIFQAGSDSLTLVAHHGPIPSLPVGALRPLVSGVPIGRSVLEARKFIELHGGRISVKSQVGVGSTFTFTLPVRRGE